ncbi:DUF2550 domain-containing protein [Jatrophihabitans telluris]|uniref:DUF2550 domain-containing protein n=1 Tax=Jatrophihabitans telluris TaxID=2038343 RepID=A0ABY4R417_9ACTN|nr:DUF2550 family protein [Jatrophihabitans telluris]UQX89871.1 DUF2550 domain-containing protein [Jatrophihabitans telluris]
MTTVEILAFVAVCLLFVLALAAWSLVVLHQRRMVSSVGGLAVAFKRGEERWANGVGRYSGDEFIWYRTLTFSPAPAQRLPRTELRVLSNRAWDAKRDMALRPNLSIVECSFRGETISLGFPDNGRTGFLSWLEAAAPRF